MRREWKTWLAFGTGVGIEIRSLDLMVTVVRVRPSGIKVLGSLTIPRFLDQPAAEWGAVYSNFLRKTGQGHLAATVLLPRDETVVREVHLPGVADADVPAALRFQIDSLHPFGEDEASYDWARAGKSAAILVGIARRRTVEKYAALLAEAGIKVHAFTFSAAALFSAIRVLSNPPSDGFLAYEEQDGQLESYGESPAHPVFSARLGPPFDRARVLALSALGLPPEIEPAPLYSLLPQPSVFPEGYALANDALPYATAVAGACPWIALDVNLLPAEERRASSRLLYVPSVVLGALVVLMTVVLMGFSRYEDRQYLGRLRAEIQKLQPPAQKAAALERQIAITRNRAQALENIRHRLRDDMNALNDLSNIVATPGWVSSLQLTRDSMSISGETERAEALLKLLDGSRQFRRSEFTLPISHGAGGENFSIHAVREGITP